MGGKNTAYVTGPLQIVGGAVATYFGMPEIGIPLMAGGIGQVSGKAAGGTGNIGEMAGLAGGGLGEGFAGLGPLGSSLGGTGAGQSLQSSLAGSSMGDILKIDPGLPASQSTQIANLAQAGFPGAQEMQTSGLPAGFPVTGASAAAAPPAPSSSSFTQLAESPLGASLASSALKPNQGQPPPTPPPASTPGFKGPLAQSPTAPKGPTPVTPAVSQVPQAPSAPYSLQEDAYRRSLLPPWFIGGTG